MAFSSDVEIAELLCADPERGFALLLRQHGGRIRGYLQRRFPSFDAVDVHDVITDALLALESSFDASRGSLAAWFLLLAHQRAVQLLRSRKRSIATAGDGHALEQPATGPDGLAGLITAERITELRQVVASLPALERAVVEADLEQGETVAAQRLAQRLGTTTGSVYAARKRARKRLLGQCRWIHEWFHLRDTKDGDAKTS